MLWGGLLPIPSILLLDSLTLCGLTFAACTPRPGGTSHDTNAMVLLATCAVTLVTAGPTNRWTLTLPMLPFLILQGLRRIPLVAQAKSVWPCRLIPFSSLLLIVLAAALSILFPAVQLPLVQGPYHVGVVDFYLPVHVSQQATGQNQTCSINDNDNNNKSSSSSLLSVRLLYPTLEQPTENIPYLTPQTAREFCRQSMKFGAPSPRLQNWGWILHTWRLTSLPVRRHAALAPPSPQSSSSSSSSPRPALNTISSNNGSTFPLVVYSHGLGGNADLYSYQAMSLAAHGTVVLLVNHLDGSAPVVQRANGDWLVFDHAVISLWKNGKKEDFKQARRAQTNQRVDELVAATEALLRINRHGLLEDETNDDENVIFGAIIDLKGRLQEDHVSFGGHSFGGATALTAAKRRPDLIRSVIAHEPVVDWMPDDARSSLLETSVDILCYGRGGDTNSQANATSRGNSNNSSSQDTTTGILIHDVDILFIFSHEWYQKKWACSHILEDLYRRGKLGRRPQQQDSNHSNHSNHERKGSNSSSKSAFHVIDQAHHTEFSDTSMITPLWLARSTGVTGSRNPIDTAREIAERTRAFLQAIS